MRGIASHHYASHVENYGQWIAVARLISLWLSARKSMVGSNATEEEVWYKKKSIPTICIWTAVDDSFDSQPL